MPAETRRIGPAFAWKLQRGSNGRAELLLRWLWSNATLDKILARY
jgi:hypothetical protein